MFAKDMSHMDGTCRLLRKVEPIFHDSNICTGNTDLAALAKALEAAQKVTDKPSLIKVSYIFIIAI